MSIITISKADSELLLNKFIKFPWTVYKGDKNWVPPLIFDVKNNLDKKKNPFFKHSIIQLFLAQKDGEYAGRIAAIINDNHNKFHNDKVGFFGFFECINDTDVSKALFEAASEFLSENGMEIIRGPVNPSTNDECGLLIEGFEMPAVMLMTYNPPYYKTLIENFGFQKAKDLYAYQIDSKEHLINSKESAE